jgi:hypothetical protein
MAGASRSSCPTRSWWPRGGADAAGCPLGVSPAAHERPLGCLFPYLRISRLPQACHEAAPLLAAENDHLARQCPSWHDRVRLIDVPLVPCGTSRETVKRSELAGWANYGYCAAHSSFDQELKLDLITNPDAMRVAWYLADPKLGEREAAGELLAQACRTAAVRPGLALIGDKGFAGRGLEDRATGGFGLQLIRLHRRYKAPRHGSIGSIRQWIEPVNDALKGKLHRKPRDGRTTEGVHARMAHRLLGMAAIWRNWATGAPVKRSLVTYDDGIHKESLI